MKITKEGWAVVDVDTHLSRWIEQTGKMDHGQCIAQKYRKWFGPGDTAIDVGACLGDHTIPYAEIVGSQGHVYAFEPNPEIFECLVHNARNYPQITCFNFGLSNVDEELGFTRHENLGASYLENKGIGTQVYVKPLDSLLSQYDFSKTKFMKIDVEGYELKVLDGAKKIIEKYRPVIMLEVSSHQLRYGKKVSDMYDWVNANKYKPGQDCDGGDSNKIGSAQYDLVIYP